jgi:hypothetical protein
MESCQYCNKPFANQKKIAGHLGKCLVYKEILNSKLTKEFLHQEYVVGLKTTTQIALENNLSIATVHRKLKYFNLNRSIAAASNLESKKNKAKKTNLERYGSDHNFNKEHPSRVAWQQKLLENEGITNVFQREEVKLKAKHTFLQKYNIESPSTISLARGGRTYSLLHKEVVQQLIENGLQVNIEKKIPKDNGYYYSFDIFLSPNILIEVNGDYWHGNPEIYHDSDIILKGSSKEIQVKEKWNLDQIKYQTAISQGYKILIIWEKDWKLSPQEQIQRILNAISENQKY